MQRGTYKGDVQEEEIEEDWERNKQKEIDKVRIKR